MIQRIQSVYLFIASLLIFALYLFPLLHNVYINGVASTIKVTGVYQDVNGAQASTQSFVALIAVTAIVALIPLVLIFLYRNRKQQISLAYVTILVLIGYSFWLSQVIKGLIGAAAPVSFSNYGIGVLLVSIAIIMVLMAIKAIQRDEKLVKSADRLR